MGSSVERSVGEHDAVLIGDLRRLERECKKTEASLEGDCLEAYRRLEADVWDPGFACPASPRVLREAFRKADLYRQMVRYQKSSAYRVTLSGGLFLELTPSMSSSPERAFMGRAQINRLLLRSADPLNPITDEGDIERHGPLLLHGFGIGVSLGLPAHSLHAYWESGTMDHKLIMTAGAAYRTSDNVVLPQLEIGLRAAGWFSLVVGVQPFPKTRTDVYVLGGINLL